MIDNLKTKYALDHTMANNNSIYMNNRLFNTYNKISNMLYGKGLNGINIDLGSGDCMFSHICQCNHINSYSYDYPLFNIERDKLDITDGKVGFVTMNAVIEHIYDPSNILNEIYRVLKPNGIVIIRTPNFQMDYKNFYNDPTHVKPYTPKSLSKVLTLNNFVVDFCEAGLICKSEIWWKLPKSIKWDIASMLYGGTKSILVIGRKP